MDHATFWRRRAAREALRFNLGWVVQMALPWVIALGLAASVAVLALRSTGSDPGPVWGALLPAAALGLAAAIFRARPRFLSRAEALTRLDADLRLQTRLTAAADGVGDWPAPRPDAALALAWRWPRLVWPPVAAAALVLAAAVIPLPEPAAARAAAQSEPPAWTATQEKLDALRQEDILPREAVDGWQSALDALRAQPREDWFRHESLEAGETLQSQLTQAGADLQKNLETALGALEAARGLENSQLQVLAQPLDRALADALKGMELGQLPLSEEMLTQLRQLDTGKVRQLSAAEWEKLAARLEQGIGTCSNGTCSGEGAASALLALILEQNGRGGVGRGPGSAPLTLSDTETQLGSNQTETVENADLSRATVGDLTGLGTATHTVDPNAWTGPQSGGTVSHAGTGSEAVYQQSTTPEEQAVLKAFFQ
jgi:hypothetical protein